MNHAIWMRSHFLNESFSQLSERQQTDRQAERKWHYCCSDRITACSHVFFWQNLSSQLLLRWKPNSQRPSRTKVIQTIQETRSGKISQLGRCDGSGEAWITLTSHPFWLLSGSQTTNSWSKILTICRLFLAYLQKHKALLLNQEQSLNPLTNLKLFAVVVPSYKGFLICQSLLY